MKVGWVLMSLLPMAVGHIIKCVSLYGLETDLKDFVCSWVNDVEHYIHQVAEMGFDTLRMPFSYQYVLEGNFERMDHFFQQAYIHNLSVIADLHRIWNYGQSYDPFDRGVTIDQLIECWATVCNRYIDFPNFVAINAYNEYQGTDTSFLVNYTATIFTAIEDKFPERFQFWATGCNWGGNLSGVSLEHLPFAERIGYSAHKYSWSGTADEADWNISIPLSLNSEKIIIGEFGWMEDKPDQLAWVKRFIAYLRKRGIQHSCYWTIAHSIDTGNLWKDDCQIIKIDNLELLKTLWRPKRLRTPTFV